MPRPLKDVVAWRNRVDPRDRILPPHLKLAILTRGRIALPPRNIAWMLEEEVRRGGTWPERLTADLADIFPTLPVTIELFVNQRPEMTAAEINEVLAAYLALRRERHLPGCLFLLFTWTTHEGRRELERKLDVDISRLYERARVRPSPREAPLYLLVVHVCFPPQIAGFIAPEQPQPAPYRPAPPPAQAMPPLEGLLSRNAEVHLREGPSVESASLGELAGHAIPVRVLDKAEDAKIRWYFIELTAELQVKKDNRPATLAAGTRAWIAQGPSSQARSSGGDDAVPGGLEMIAAPWDFFRYQLDQLEQENQSLPLPQRITLLRQMSHVKRTPFDTVIGTKPGRVYKDMLPFVAGRWQLFGDYDATRAPDGRLVDVHHLLVGLDVLGRPETPAYYLSIHVGTNHAAATWAGDVGSGAADMTQRADRYWERRQTRAEVERAEYYFNTRASERDLLADVDAWGIHALRRPDISTIDGMLALYYEALTPGGQRPLTAARQDALERFLRHHGFRYELSADLARYPSLHTQAEPTRRVSAEILAFGRIWMFNRNPALLASRDEARKRPEPEDLRGMILQFLYWLEVQAIENGAEVPRARR